MVGLGTLVWLASSFAQAEPPEAADTSCTMVSNDTCIRRRLHTEEAVCQRFVQDTMDRSTDSIWTPGEARCDPGTTSTVAVTDALQRTNLYRWLLGLNPVSERPELRPGVEQCALMQSLRGQPSMVGHYPSEDWECWTESGSAASAQSNLCGKAGADIPSLCLDRLIIDAGENNALKLGHRRWVLRPSLESVAFGFSAAGTMSATCMGVYPVSPYSPPSQDLSAIVTWPPAGVVPLELGLYGWSQVHPRNISEETLRWSVVAEGIDFEGATAKVYIEKTPGQRSRRDTRVRSSSARLLEGVGDGLWIEPGLPVLARTSYRVEVKGSSAGDFYWRTTFVDCGLLVPESCDPIAQNCPFPGTACYEINSVFQCWETSLPRPGESCRGMNECPAGSTCTGWGAGEEAEWKCSSFCTLPESTSPNAGTSCAERCSEMGWRPIESTDWAQCR